MYYRVAANLGGIPYSPSFPNIRANRPELYDAAIRAEGTVEKLKWFKDVYFLLAKATADARLALDNSDQVVVIPEEKSVENLLGPKLVKAALKASGKSLARHLVGEDFGRVLGILDLLLKLKTALEFEEGRRLVSEQNASRRHDAYSHKLRFFIRLRIARYAPGGYPVDLASRIEAAFWAYQKALGELWKYQNIEKNLEEGISPYQRRAPRYGPVPPGL